MNIKHRTGDGRGKTTRRRGLQRTASVAEEEDRGRMKQSELGGWENE